MRKSQVALVVLGAIAFGLLMAARDGFENIWLRALIAGIGGGIAAAFFAAAVLSKRRDDRHQSS